MDSEDDLISQSASSSGISDSDVTILGDETLHRLIGEVERILKEKDYSVATPLCAGRLKIENALSRVSHARLKIILLTKATADDHQTFINSIPRRSHYLTIPSTLIFCEDGIPQKRISRSNRRFSQIKVPVDNPEAIAELICWFLDVAVDSERQDITNQFEVRKLFIDLLIHSVINPQRLPDARELKLSELEDLFKNTYGSFRNLQVTRLEEHLKKSDGFILENDVVKQSNLGLDYVSRLLRNYSNDVRNTTTLPKDVLMQRRGLEDEEVDSELRVDDWVSTSKQNISILQKRQHEENLAMHIHEFNSGYSFFLLTSKLPQSAHLCGVMNVPWLKVIDFDVDSRKSGFLSAVEKCIKSKRSFTITAGKDGCKPISDKATDWFFPLGFSDRADTTFAGKALQWYSSHKPALEQQCSDMSEFCVCQTLPVFLILWYDYDNNDTQCLEFFLSVLYPEFTSDTLVKKVILCIKEKPDDTSALHQLITKYQLESSTVIIPLENVCTYLKEVCVSDSSTSRLLKLPKASNDDNTITGTVEISEELLWIQQYIELLPLETQDEVLKRQSQDAGKAFVKGGAISWDEVSTGKIAVARDIQDEVYKSLESDIVEGGRTVVFRIMHSPGGGGTTFARQLMWYLHSEVPCGVVIPSPTLPISQLKERAEAIYEKTHLPVVLLVDGRSDHEIEQFYESCRYAVVILHVKRRNKNIPKGSYDSQNRICYLPGKVTATEASKLTQVFSEFAPHSKDALEVLTEKIGTEDRFLFEYGLTAFNHEFKGLRNYVNGYLELHKRGIQLQDLLPWQKVVAYLSLILYYGQGGLHRETFHFLLKGKNDHDFVSLGDLPYSGQQFIVETNREWKINYYVVAKEILEQVLSRIPIPEQQDKKFLSKAAVSNLHELINDLIFMLTTTMAGKNSEHLIQRLCDVILRRNYNDMDIGDAYGKKPRFSRLLEDVPEGENRIKILQNLTKAFPHHTEFHAHLGRLLSLMDKFKDAEKSLQTALNLRIKERSKKNLIGPDNVRGRIHHMFGFACIRRAKHELDVQKKSIDDVVKHVMPHCEKAVHHFTKGRQYITSSNRSYGYTGEVRARMLIVEYVHKEYPGGCVAAFNGKLDKENMKLGEFVRESHSTCDQLLAECQRYTPEAELKKIDIFYTCVEKFNKCFKNIVGNFNIWNKRNNIPIRRSQIISLKHKYQSTTKSSQKEMPSVDTIQSKYGLTQIIRLYETTFQEVFKGNLCYISISLDILEWLDAIRHHLIEDTYTLVKILHTVEAWEQRNEVGFATYYLYVVYYVLSIYCPGQKMNIEYNKKTNELKEKLRNQKNRLVNMRVTREWLADHDDLTIRKLINRNELGTWDNEKRFWKTSEALQGLQVCTGTVIKSFRQRAGTISLDIPHGAAKYRVEVYFVPIIYNLVGKRYSDQSTRVEFFIGFSAERGAEALSVKELKRSLCPNCQSYTEIITLNQDGKGKCSKCQYILK